MEYNMNLVFVYGSLKKGFGNHRLLENSKYIAKGGTVSEGFDMGSCGGFPGVTSGGEYRIYGELYEVDDDTFERLDTLEGNGHFYEREEIDIMSISQPAARVYKAWIYILDNYNYYRSDISRIEIEEKFKAKIWKQ